MSPFLVYKTSALSVKLLKHHFISLFSNKLVVGRIRRNKMKYRMDAIWPMIINGSSTGCAPIHVKIKMLVMVHQNVSWERGRKVIDCCFDVWSDGISARISTENNKAKTPPILFGMDRRMA